MRLTVAPFLQGSSADSSPSVEEPSPKALLLQFWRAFAQANPKACQVALRALRDVKGGSVFLFEEVSNLTEGEFKDQIELPETPSKTVDAWNSTKTTTMVRVDPCGYVWPLTGISRRTMLEGNTK